MAHIDRKAKSGKAAGRAAGPKNKGLVLKTQKPLSKALLASLKAVSPTIKAASAAILGAAQSPVDRFLVQAEEAGLVITNDQRRAFEEMARRLAREGGSLPFFGQGFQARDFVEMCLRFDFFRLPLHPSLAGLRPAALVAQLLSSMNRPAPPLPWDTPEKQAAAAQAEWARTDPVQYIGVGLSLIHSGQAGVPVQAGTTDISFAVIRLDTAELARDRAGGSSRSPMDAIFQGSLQAFALHPEYEPGGPAGGGRYEAWLRALGASPPSSGGGGGGPGVGG